MYQIAKWLSEDGWILRSGGAIGADYAFEQGCDSTVGEKEIFLPCKDYNDNKSQIFSPPQSAYNLIDDIWNDLNFRSSLVRALFARNCQLVLGSDLTSPSSIVICWTRDGRDTGGTGRAILIARRFNIPVVNLHDKWKHRFLTDKETFFNNLEYLSG